MAKKYVPDGVFLACDKGTCPSTFKVTNHKKTTIYNSPMATEGDLFPFFNIKPMGFCTNPAKILATGAMCTPVVLQWEKPKDGVTIDGKRLLLEDSTCKCTLGGGEISIHFDIASANTIAVWGGMKMPTEYIKEGFDWAFATIEESRAERNKYLPEWMEPVADVHDWFDDMTLALLEGAVTGVVGLGEVVYQVAQDPVGMGEALYDMAEEAYQWQDQKKMEALLWMSKKENWEATGDATWDWLTEEGSLSSTAKEAWEGVENAVSSGTDWLAKNPRKLGTVVGEFVPDAVGAAYTGGATVALTAGKKIVKEVGEEIVEEVVEKVAKEAVEEASEAASKKAIKEVAEEVVEETGKDLPKVVTKDADEVAELKMLPPPKVTTKKTLKQVRNLRGRKKWEAGEEYVQDLYGSNGQKHYTVPKDGEITGTGGRHVDAPVEILNNGILAIEVKTYNRYITVEGAVKVNEVPLSNSIKQQILKDVWLRDNINGYDPRWIFLDAPPSSQLSDFLQQKNIISIIYN